MSDDQNPVYVLGHSDREFRRLQMQGRIYEDATMDLLRDAGVGPGMRVLDIGCGVGDVALLAAQLVGPGGDVIAIDHSPAAIETARARAADRDIVHIDFRCDEFETVQLDGPVDALVGRFILMHQADPAATLASASAHVRPGGAVAMLESHMELSMAGVHSHPHSPVFDTLMGWMIEVIRRAGAHTDMGLQLRRVFVEAGLPAPELRLQAYLGGGPDDVLYEYTIESMRSMLPLAREYGITDLNEDDLDELQTELRADVVHSGGVLASPLVVGAWTRL